MKKNHDEEWELNRTKEKHALEEKRDKGKKNLVQKNDDDYNISMAVALTTDDMLMGLAAGGSITGSMTGALIGKMLSDSDSDTSSSDSCCDSSSSSSCD